MRSVWTTLMWRGVWQTRRRDAGALALVLADVEFVSDVQREADEGHEGFPAPFRSKFMIDRCGLAQLSKSTESLVAIRGRYF